MIGKHMQFHNDHSCFFFENLKLRRFYNRVREEMCSMKWHSTSPPCGNSVDGLPHDCPMETVAKPARLRPAQKGKLMHFFIELTMFCIMIEEKALRISCPEYIDD